MQKQHPPALECRKHGLANAFDLDTTQDGENDMAVLQCMRYLFSQLRVSNNRQDGFQRAENFTLTQRRVRVRRKQPATSSNTPVHDEVRTHLVYVVGVGLYVLTRGPGRCSLTVGYSVVILSVMAFCSEDHQIRSEFLLCEEVCVIRDTKTK